LGLTKFYKDPSSIEGHFLKFFFGTPFLKPSDVEGHFLGLCEILPCNNSGIVQFSDYIIDNYISEEALFLHHIWASASNVSYRTTNACESFHAKFNTTFYQNHPNLYQFIEVLLQFQSQIYAKIKGASKIKKLVDKPA
jgi:ABC-type Zn uptake system ZnuABC Zn-binding protein ZnuA